MYSIILRIFFDILLLGVISLELYQFDLLDFGIFDSRIKFPNVSVTKPRPVECYEIEILTGDFCGCSYIDNHVYPHDKFDFICAKPGQIRYSRLPFKCFYLHVRPQNEEAIRLLSSLPETMKIGNIREYSSIFSSLIRMEHTESGTERLYISSALCQILALILQDASIASFQTGVIGNKEALLNAESYLRCNFSQNITLQTLSAVANLSPIYFHKLFTAYFHKTPNQFLLDLRIAHAKRMLLEEDFSLSDIALACGFTSQSYFCSRFKKANGQTPLQYRRKALSRVNI